MYDSSMKSTTYPVAMPDDLLGEIRRAAEQTKLSMADVIRQSTKLMKQFCGRAEAGTGAGDKLSDRELQVFQLVGSGLATRDVVLDEETIRRGQASAHFLPTQRGKPNLAQWSRPRHRPPPR